MAAHCAWLHRGRPLSRRLDQLEKKAAATGAEAEAARRALESLFVQASFNLPREFAARGERAKAALALQLAAELRPAAAVVHYNLACSLALLGDRKGALSSLEEAVARGFHDLAQLTQDPDLASLRAAVSADSVYDDAIARRIRADSGGHGRVWCPHSAAAAGDAVGLLVWADTVRRYIPPGRGRSQVGVIIEAIHDLTAEPVESDVAGAFAYFSTRWKRRSLLVAFTDAEDPDQADDLARAMGPLAKRHIAVLGSDSAGEVRPTGVEGMRGPMHTLVLVAMGVPILDNCDFEDLSKVTAGRKRWEFLLTTAPLAVRGATGSALNPIAVF